MTAIRRAHDARLGKRRVCALVVALALSTTHGARAESTSAVLAEALFRAGRQALRKHEIAEACDKFAESQRLEPKLGTLLNLAACHEQMDKTATAWVEFNQALAQARAARRSDHEALALAHLADLSKRLSLLTIRWNDSAPERSLSIDGVSVGVGGLGIGLPLDPGTHRIEASAPERIPVELEVTLARGPADQSVELPVLAEVSPAPTEIRSSSDSSVPVAPPHIESVAAGDQPTPPRPFPRPEQRVNLAAPQPKKPFSAVATVALVTGAGAIGLGAYAGLHAFSLKHLADQECDATTCSPRGLELYSQVETYADVSTASFVIGALGVGTAIFVLAIPAPSAPHDRHKRPDVSVEIHSSGAKLRGRF